MASSWSAGLVEVRSMLNSPYAAVAGEGERAVSAIGAAVCAVRARVKRRSRVGLHEQETEGKQDPDCHLLPTAAPWDQLEALGFRRGEPADDVSTYCAFPDGWVWQRRPCSTFWSDVLDERGVPRVAIFHKGAWYDRRAHAVVTRPGYEAGVREIFRDGPPVLPEQWEVFTDEERADYLATLHQYRQWAAERPEGYGDRLPRIVALIALVRPSAASGPSEA